MNIVGHQKQWDFLKKRFESNQLSHAYLFAGPEEIGKRKFALELIKMINCQGNDEKGECQNCKLIENEKHPDVLMVEVKKDKSEIEISQIREVQQFLSLKPYYSSFKAVIIDEAQKMNQEAQSCFLKTLEEPKGRTILILISSRPEILLPTILSRCQLIKFFACPITEIKNYLIKNGASEEKAEMFSSISEGKSGRAIKLFLEPDKMEKEKKILKEVQEICGLDLASKFQYVKNLPEEDFDNLINSFRRYFRYLLFLKIMGSDFKISNYYPSPSEKLKLYSIAKIKQIIKLIEVIDFRFLTTNINPKLALEILLLEL